MSEFARWQSTSLTVPMDTEVAGHDTGNKCYIGGDYIDMFDEYIFSHPWVINMAHNSNFGGELLKSLLDDIANYTVSFIGVFHTINSSNLGGNQSDLTMKDAIEVYTPQHLLLIRRSVFFGSQWSLNSTILYVRSSMALLSSTRLRTSSSMQHLVIWIGYDQGHHYMMYTS